MNKKWWRLLYAYEKFTHRQARASFFITDEDRQYAIQKFSLEQGLCFVATYGIEEADPPVALDKINAHRSLCKTLGINPSSLLLLFNGSLDYIPNQNAVKKIIADIQPRLKTILKTEYTIVICGKASPHMTALLLAQQYNGISYVGFVPDIRAYFLGADIFLNPVTEGGGIKTKLVEALAADTPCVSFKSGAWGLPLSVTGNRLKIVEDDDYESFCRAVVTIVEEKTMTPITRSFYDHFNQQKIAEKVSAIISTILNNDNLK